LHYQNKRSLDCKDIRINRDNRKSVTVSGMGPGIHYPVFRHIVMWTAESATSDEYQLVACVPVGGRLYILIEGPSSEEDADAAPAMPAIIATATSGEVLNFRSLTASSADGGRRMVYLGEFGAPPAVTDLDLRLQLRGLDVFAVRARAVRYES
jgi:hypothetical protein